MDDLSEQVAKVIEERMRRALGTAAAEFSRELEISHPGVTARFERGGGSDFNLHFEGLPPADDALRNELVGRAKERVLQILREGD